jgi:hypothetical protein
MAEVEHHCLGCQNGHYAAAWYSRRVQTGTEYICGVEYTRLANKAGWTQIYPAESN